MRKQNAWKLGLVEPPAILQSEEDAASAHSGERDAAPGGGGGGGDAASVRQISPSRSVSFRSRMGDGSERTGEEERGSKIKVWGFTIFTWVRIRKHGIGSGMGILDLELGSRIYNPAS